MSSLSSFIWVKGRLPVSVFSTRAVYVTMERKRERERSFRLANRSSKDFMFICSLQLCGVVLEKRSNISEKVVGNSFSFRGLKGEIKVNEGGNGVLQLL